MADNPNVVLIILDTTRADDALTPAVAPTIADIGAAGTTVDDIFSPAPWTLPSHASILTGTYPSRHGAHAGHERLDDTLPTVPELFQQAGYETVCLSNNTWVSIEGGFGRGFDSFQQMWQLVQSNNALGELVDVTEKSRLTAVSQKILEGDVLANVANTFYRIFVREHSDDGAERTTKWITRWLAERDDDRPFFLLANYLEPHLEYRPPRRLAGEFLPEGWQYGDAMDVPQKPWEYLAGHVTLDDEELQVLRGLYRAEIAYLDEQLATLKRSLVESGEWENTVLVLTADHGENIGHHGLMDHQYCLYDSLIRVPLVLHGGPFDDGDGPPGPSSLVDLAPTMLDVAGIDAPRAREGFQGQSLHPDAPTAEREFVVSEYHGPQPTMEALERHVGDLPNHVYRLDRSLRAIRTGEYKLVRGSDGSIELYDLVADPRETHDVARANPDRVEGLSGKLDDWLGTFEQADADGPVSLDGQRKKQLEELGYLQ